eukprot:2884112-Amphidinium_carterae.1
MFGKPTNRVNMAQECSLYLQVSLYLLLCPVRLRLLRFQSRVVLESACKNSCGEVFHPDGLSAQSHLVGQDSKLRPQAVIIDVEVRNAQVTPMMLQRTADIAPLVLWGICPLPSPRALPL